MAGSFFLRTIRQKGGSAHASRLGEITLFAIPEPESASFSSGQLGGRWKAILASIAVAVALTWPGTAVGENERSAGDSKSGQGSDSIGLLPNPAPSPESYLLDTGDHLHVRFYDRYDRDDLNGNYVIGENGQLRLPRIGAFQARNKTPVELESDIRKAFESKGEKLGHFFVDVARCRPYYITGVVQHPGAYAFVPGLTVLHAVSLAGGLNRVQGVSPAEVMREKGTLIETLSRANELVGRRARLEADRDESQTIQMPQELIQLDPLRARAILAGERSVLDQSRQLLNQEKSGLESLIALKRTEAASYESEIGRLWQRIEEQTENFAQLEKLREAKIINQQRFLEAVVTLEALRREKQAAFVGLSQTKTNLEKAQRDLALLMLGNKVRIAKEIAETELELTRLKRVAAQSRAIVANFDALAGESMSGQVAYKIMRRNAGGSPEFVEASETTPIMPGDVIQIDIRSHLELFAIN